MKRGYSLFVTILNFTIVCVFLSTSTAQSFWYGESEKLYESLGPDATAAFNTCLIEEVLPYSKGDINQTNLENNWYNKLDELYEEQKKEVKDKFLKCLTDYVVPGLDANLTFNDNRNGEEGVIIHNSAETYGGYTLLSSIMGHGCNQAPPTTGVPLFSVYNGATLVSTNTCGAILIDMNGDIVNEWPLMAVPAKILPEGNVLGMAFTPANGMAVGGIQSMVQMDWCGAEEWRWPNSSYTIYGGARVHHDFQREGNPVGYFAPGQDTYLFPDTKNLVLSNIISYTLPFPPFTHYPSPYAPLVDQKVSTYDLLEDVIYEVDSFGDVTWEWYPFEHFDQMGFDQTAKDGIRNVRVAGIGGVAGAGETTDWQHINSASYLGPNKWYDEEDVNTWIYHPENVIYDSRTANYMAIIARVPHPKGKWAVGDIVWRVGPHYSKGYEEENLGQIIGPHMAHMIPEGLPGAGNILVFDNGGVAGYGSLLPGSPGTYPATFRDYSRVLEFDPVTLKKVWEYKETGESGRKFYSRLISGAQRLENGNTQITEGTSGRVFEVTPEGEVVWEYIHKAEYANGAFPLLGFLPPTAIYRAYRIPEAWLPTSLTCP